jgi:hypothetical protein
MTENAHCGFVVEALLVVEDTQAQVWSRRCLHRQRQIGSFVKIDVANL